VRRKKKHFLFKKFSWLLRKRYFARNLQNNEMRKLDINCVNLLILGILIP